MAREFKLSNGVAIPAVGYGSYLSTKEKGVETLKEAFQAGYRYIDTAMFYQNEGEIGAAIQEYGLKRDEVFLASKVWPTMLGEEKTLQSFEDSCRALRTDYLDLFLIHWPKASQREGWERPLVEAWRVLEKLYQQGRVRAIGVANFLPHHLLPLLEAARVAPMLDQLELHVGYMQEYTLSYLEREGILPQAWSPLGRGKLIQDERIGALAAKYGVSSGQILLRYLLQRGIPVIPKSSSPERMRENLDLFGFEMSWEDISYLSCLPQTGWSGEHPDLAELD